MSEKKDYKKLKEGVFDGTINRIDRIENIMVAGMPDVNVCVRGVESWIEIKSPAEPKRTATKLFGSNHKLNQDQKNWIKRQINAGGMAFVLIATDKRWMLIRGEHADFINDMTVKQLVDISDWVAETPFKQIHINALRARLQWK